MEDLNRALALKPNHIGALTQRGHAYLRAQKFAQALTDYTAAVGVPATNIEALYGRGAAKVYSGDIDAGQADMTAALLIDSSITARMTAQGIPPPQIQTVSPKSYSRPESKGEASTSAATTGPAASSASSPAAASVEATPADQAPGRSQRRQGPSPRLHNLRRPRARRHR